MRVQHVSGKDTTVAVVLSRIEVVQSGIEFEALAVSQETDENIKRILCENFGSRLKKFVNFKDERIGILRCINFQC